MVREAVQSDLDAILELYLFLHEDSIPEEDEHLRDTWLQMGSKRPRTGLRLCATECPGFLKYESDKEKQKMLDF